jgi:hypothetical protein
MPAGQAERKQFFFEKKNQKTFVLIEDQLPDFGALPH